MALKNYSLQSPSTVILFDGRDPFRSWERHLATTNRLRGGVDIVAAVGTPIYARTSGVMKWLPNNASAGNSAEFYHDENEGWADVFSHLSRYVGRDGQHFNKGEIVAYSGNSGNVDQHLHWHLLDPNKARRNPWLYFSETSSTASNITAIIESITQGETMNLFHLVTTTGDQAYIYQGAASQQIIGGAYLAALEKGYGVKAIQVNEYDWDAITSTFSKDLAALAATLGVQTVTTALTVEGIAKEVNDEAARRLAD